MRNRLTSRLIFLAIVFAGLLVSLQSFNTFKLYVKQAFTRQANLLVDAGSSYDKMPVWKNYAQGGEENGRMLQIVASEMRPLEPDFIRIDHVFDFYNVVSRDASGELVFNWGDLDKTLSDIRLMGAKPFISISYMPTALSSGLDTDCPTNWVEWEQLVQALVEHISGMSNLAEEDVYYEVWNEPDLFGDFKTYGEKNYLELYSHTAKAAMEAKDVHEFKIGGPATTSYYVNWLEALVKLASVNDLPLDFLSWHKYSLDVSESVEDVYKAKRFLVDYPKYKDVELIISEAGFNSEIDKRYDTDFAAIYTLSLMSVLDDEVDRVFSFEIKDGPGSEKYWGRWGILTNEKFGNIEKKPRYFAFEFLQMMVGNKVNVAGEGTYVKAMARIDGGVLRLLVVNYDPQGSHTEYVPIRIINLENGNYRVTRHDFDGTHNSQIVEVLDNVLEMNEFFGTDSASIVEIVINN